MILYIEGCIFDGQGFIHKLTRLSTMTVTATSKGTARPLASVVLRYGLAFASIAAAMGLARLFLYFHLPQPFAAFALSAIAITFWYGGNMPGIVAALLASIIRYTHWSETQAVSRVIYDLVFLIFAFLMMAINRARSDLEVRVAERTADLTRANEELSLKIAEHKRTEDKLRESEAYLAEAQRLSGTGSWARVSATGKMRYWSEECFRVLGFDPHDGPPPFETFLQRVHPGDQAKVRELSEKAAPREGRLRNALSNRSSRRRGQRYSRRKSSRFQPIRRAR